MIAIISFHTWKGEKWVLQGRDNTPPTRLWHLLIYVFSEGKIIDYLYLIAEHTWLESNKKVDAKP